MAKLSSSLFIKSVQFAEQSAAPPTPGTGLEQVYIDTSGRVWVLDNLGIPHAVAPQGYAPYANQPGFAITDAIVTALNLPISGGSIAIPILVPGHMLLQSLTIWNTDAASARAAEWRLYRDVQNNSNTLNEVANANGTYSFTPGAAALQISTPATAPIYLAPGLLWLVLRNTSGAQTFGLGSTAAGNLATNTGQTKTLGSGLGATLDFVAATWTKVTAAYGVRLNGRVFAQASAF